MEETEEDAVKAVCAAGPTVIVIATLVTTA
jgi:hypothetical protein